MCISSFRQVDKSLANTAKMEKRRAYLDHLLSFMIEPSQDDLIFVSHRDDDDLGHNHDGDLGTELRSAAVRECKELARQ